MKNFAKLTRVSASSLNLKPNFKPTITFAILENLLRQCQSFKLFHQILSQMILTGFIKDTNAASRVLKFSTYSPFIPIHHSLQIFTRIENPNGFVYNTLAKAYIRRNSPQEAMYLYKLMRKNNVGPDHYTYPIVVHACALRFAEFEGKLIHGHVLKICFESNVYVQNTLIDMYGVCGNLIDARKLFDESSVLDLVSWNSILTGYVGVRDVDEACRLFDNMPEKDLVSWSAMISCFEKSEKYDAALVKFIEMLGNGIRVDEVVMLNVLSACTHLEAAEIGKLTHGLVVKVGVDSYVNLRNALIHMYSSCGEIMAAEWLFNGGYILDQISWNSMISGYMKCGSVEKAKALFDSMPEKDIVSWTAIISGYSQHDRFSETLSLFREMQLNGISPEETTLVPVISACTHLNALDQGKWIHVYLRKYGLKISVILGTALIDMYMKCGCVENALDVFDGMKEIGISIWNALIHGLAMNGLVYESLHLFSEMKKHAIVPNEITFMAVLDACRQIGLVDEGRRHFKSMIEELRMKPNVKHYGCMVDLLGRAGLLKEAEKLIESMPMSPEVATWGALLGACRKHGDYEMGERVGRKLVELQPDHHGFHVLLSNICASKGNWNDVLNIRGMMMRNRVVKTPGCSMIEVNGTVHEFLAGDNAHPQIKKIEHMLDEIASRLKMEGYAHR